MKFREPGATKKDLELGKARFDQARLRLAKLPVADHEFSFLPCPKHLCSDVMLPFSQNISLQKVRVLPPRGSWYVRLKPHDSGICGFRETYQISVGPVQRHTGFSEDLELDRPIDRMFAITYHLPDQNLHQPVDLEEGIRQCYGRFPQLSIQQTIRRRGSSVSARKQQ